MRSSSEATRFELEPDDVTASGPFVPSPLSPAEAVPDFVDAEPPSSPDPEPDAEAVRRAAFEEGRQAGRAELPWQEARQLETAIVALESALAAFAAERSDYLRAQRTALVELALEIAERVLVRELEADPSALVGLVEGALDALPPESREGDLAIRLSPADHAVLAAGEGDALTRLSGAGAVQLVADASLAPGDVRVEAGAATLDARRTVLLDRVREALAPAVAAAAPGDSVAEETG